MKMLRLIPQIPVAQVSESLIFYKKLNFTVEYQEEDFAVIYCGNVKIHLWKTNDLKMLGNSNFQIEVNGLDRLYTSLLTKGLIDSDTTIENYTKVLRVLNLLDPDKNLISFIERKILVIQFNDKRKLKN
ncbi:hypothetical protein [Gottfriedia acidiceleris]|uniref:hypothetical protein n=1 Tax=Gottfriedia acidiceleris TaxID=371036 RepID=UPI003D198497